MRRKAKQPCLEDLFEWIPETCEAAQGCAPVSCISEYRNFRFRYYRNYKYRQHIGIPVIVFFFTSVDHYTGNYSSEFL